MADVVPHLTLHVKPQVDLVEIPVKGDREPAYSRVEKLKADRADECPALPEIELGPGGNAWGERVRRDLVVDHHEIAPSRGQEVIRA